MNEALEIEALYVTNPFSRDVLIAHPLATDRMLFHGMRSGVRAAWEHPNTSLLWVTCAGRTDYLDKLRKDPALGIAHGLYVEIVLLEGFDAAYGTAVWRSKEVGVGVPEALRPVLEWLLDSWMRAPGAFLAFHPLPPGQILLTRAGMTGLADWLESSEETPREEGNKEG